MANNLTNQIKTQLFKTGTITVTTTGGDISPEINQPAESGVYKFNLNQRDYINILLFADENIVTAGATATISYFINQTNDTPRLLTTETLTFSQINNGSFESKLASNSAIEFSDYCTISILLKQAVTTNYKISGTVILKKKIINGGTPSDIISGDNVVFVDRVTGVKYIIAFTNGVAGSEEY